MAPTQDIRKLFGKAVALGLALNLAVLGCAAPGDLEHDFSFHEAGETGVAFPSSQGAFASEPGGTILFGAIFPDGKTSVLQSNGTEVWVAASNTNGLIRFNTDGTRDETLHPITLIEIPFQGDPQKSRAGIVRGIVLQPDGKILIFGNFMTVNGIALKDEPSPNPGEGFARLEANGELDLSFDPEALPKQIETVAIQPDGKMVVAGVAAWEAGEAGIFRLNSDGSLDPAFNAPYDAFICLSVLLQSDGKLLIGGAFDTVHGVRRRGVARLNADGTLDSSFVDPNTSSLTGPEAGTVSCMALQPDGKILIGGAFNRVAGVSRNCIARLNSNGTLDTTFNPGAGLFLSRLYPEARSVALQANGKILIAGWFDQVAGVSRTNIARLNADGSLDTTFDSAAAATVLLVSTVALQPGGKMLASGLRKPGTSNNQLFRLFGGDALPTLTLTRNGGTALTWPVSEGAGYSLEFTDALGSAGDWRPEPSETIVVGEHYLVPIDTSLGSRFFRLRRE